MNNIVFKDQYENIYLNLIIDKEVKYKVSELIELKLLKFREYIYKENFDYFHDRYYTEQPNKDIKVINDYEINIFKFNKYKSDAIIYEESTESFYKVELLINITDLYIEDQLKEVYIDIKNKNYDVFYNNKIKDLKISDINNEQLLYLLDYILEIEIVKTIKINKGE